MSGDPTDEGDSGSGAPEPGRRRDGKPFKDGDTRADGSYKNGKGRTPEEHRFRAGDNRKRGKREKGSKNLATIWRKKLAQKIKHQGKEQTALEWLVEGTILRGISRSDRASENALSAAGRLEGERERQLGQTDNEIIDAWLLQRLSEAADDISDDNEDQENDDAD